MKKELFLKLGGPAALLTLVVATIQLSGWSTISTVWVAVVFTAFCLSNLEWKKVYVPGKFVPELGSNAMQVGGYAPAKQLRNVSIAGWIFTVCIIVTAVQMHYATWDARYYAENDYRAFILYSGSLAWFLFSGGLVLLFARFKLLAFAKFWWFHTVLGYPAVDADQTA